MQHNLLNPNKLRSFGMLVKDDPFASNEPIRIESENGDAVLPLHTGDWNPSEFQFPKTSQRVEEELTIRLIASDATEHGMSTMKIDDLLYREDCLYSIGQLSHRMLSCVRVLDAPTVEQVRISDMEQPIANTSEETNNFTPTTFQSSQ